MVRRLTRNRRKAMLGGVAAGFGDYFDVDPVLVRLGFVLLTFATGIGILFYIICWVIMPDDEASVPRQRSPGEKMSEDVKEAAERVASEARGVGEEARVAAERVASEVREVGESGRVHLIGGAILVAFGLMLLADRIPWMFDWPYWLRFDNAWPLILVAIGVALVMRSREEKA